VVGITKTITTFWLFFQIIVSVVGIHTYNNLEKQPKGSYCLSNTDHTYNTLNKQLKGIVIVLVVPTTLTIVRINNQMQTIVSVVGITKTITVPFGCLFRLL
jgi:hypothetical protein